MAIVFAAALGLFVPRLASADPNWWPDPTEVPNLAAQSGKGIVLYFQNDSARDCIRMDRETWLTFRPEKADKDFIWLRLNPKDNKSFFSYYEIFQVPQIVLLDYQFGERERLKGYVSGEELRRKMAEVPRGKPSVMTTTDGQVITALDPLTARRHRKEIENQKPFFYESFDDYEKLSQLRRPRFAALSRGATRIDPTSGMYGSSCLVIDSGDKFNAQYRIDLSDKIQGVAQLEGRVHVSARMRAITLGDEVENVGSLMIQKKTAPGAPPARPKTRHLTLSNRHGQFTERTILSEPFSFKTHDLYLTFQVAWQSMSFCIDDVRVDLLPVDGDGEDLPKIAASAPNPSALLAPPTESSLFLRFDTDGDGKILRSELPEGSTGTFDMLDGNGDGVLTFVESVKNMNRLFPDDRGLAVD